MDIQSSYTEFKDYSSRFKFIRKCKDPVLGDSTLLKDTAFNRTVISYEKPLRSHELFNQEVQACELLSKLNALPHLTKFYGYSYKLTPRAIGKSCIFYYVREYLEFDLEREVNIHLKNKVTIYYIYCLTL